MDRILNDEPTEVDELDRSPYTLALSRTILRCETPFTIGVYGDWGAGKTSLLRLIARRIGDEAKCVWFNAWLYQQHQDPALALLHTIATDLHLGDEAKKLLAIVGATLATTTLKVTTQVGIDDIQKIAEQYEKEQFQQRDERTRLREKFQKFIDKARGPQKKRLIVFIDDLDRCLPEQALSVLEAIKLYLNISGCVYIIAADRIALERAVSTRYGTNSGSNARYLDKIVQLPFLLPPIHPNSLDAYVRMHLDENLHECADLLVAGLGPNPRAIKRFANVLTLNNELASDLDFPDYELRWLCIVLLIQYHDPEKYLVLSTEESTFESILAKKNEEPNPRLRAVLEKIEALPNSLQPYIHLAAISSVEDEESTPQSAFMAPLQPSSELAAIVGNKPIPRTEIVSRMWSYIKRNGLQDPSNKRMINADDLLRPIFQKDQVSMFEMAATIGKHLQSPDSSTDLN